MLKILSLCFVKLIIDRINAKIAESTARINEV